MKQIPWNKGKIGGKLSDETRKKMSLARMGEKNPFFGRKLTPEESKRMSEIRKNNPNRARYWLGKKRSPETIAKMSQNRKGKMTGKNHFAWKEDRNSLKDDYKDRGGQLHRAWSRAVKNRDGWKCKISNDTCSGKLESHHILGWKDYPELRYQINNGITLCHAHHPRKRAEEKRLAPHFTELVSVSKN